MATPSSKSRIASLDGARAVSIALVVLGHAGALLPQNSRFRPFLEDRGGANLGVNVFFVLSGYLITRLLLTEEDRRGRVSLGQFYLRRAFRILPALYAYIAFLAVLTVLGVLSIPGAEFLEAMTFTWNYRGGGWWLGHTWSLSVEEQFYLFWPTLLALAGRKRARNIALAIVILEPFIRVASYFAFPSQRGFIPIMGHTNMDVLLVGCLLAMADYSTTARERLARVLTAGPAAVVLFVLVTNMLLGNRLRGSYVLSIGISVQTVAIALLLFWLIHNAKSTVGHVLNWGPVAWVGRISYSLYLWQQFFLVWEGQGPSRLPFPANVVAAIVAAVAAAATSYYLLEQPMLSVRDGVLRRMRPSPSTGPRYAKADVAERAD
jgi:peptidoglycan/LPS O-acetylase OafA/YrhL